MSARAFVDTNVFIYMFDASSPAKQARSRQVVEEIALDGSLVLSTQVLQEFYVGVTRKLGRPLPEEAAERAVRDMCAFHVVGIDRDAVVAAISLSRKHRISPWDGLIITSAAGSGCRRLLSEDLQHGAVIAGVRIENPFLA